MESRANPLFVHHEIIADPNQTLFRLDRFLTDRLPAITRTRIQAGIVQHTIQVNGKPAKPSYKVKPGDTIRVVLPIPPKAEEILPENIPIDIVYEDAYLLLVNKKAEMVVHPGIGNWTGTLVNALVYHFQALPAAEGNQRRPGLVHRIDKGTSGLLLVAKTETCLSLLAKQFNEHTIQRTYYALVWGSPAEDQGTIDFPVGRSLADHRVMTTYHQEDLRGKPSITHYKVIQRFGYVTLIQCQLETGRTHQIRAHMQHLGHPLFGDPRYGGDRIVKGQQFSKYRRFVQNCFAILPYQALHAYSLGFVHPITKKKHYFEVPFPTAFATVLAKWERYANGLMLS